MTHGIDTDFLVAVEIREHPFHLPADALLQKLLNFREDLAVAPQSLAEFIHVVTDPKRMPQPLTMIEAVTRAEHWWQAAEVRRIFSSGESVTDFLSWLSKYQLGRKRLLDTLLAASYRQEGITRIITNNRSDYAVFGCFEIVPFR